MAERLNAPHSKCGIPKRYRGFKSSRLRHSPSPYGTSAERRRRRAILEETFFMNNEFKPKKLFTKNEDNLNMLKQALESNKIDNNLIPILEKFFSLPITPRESCYGHPETNKKPYLSYVNDQTQNEHELKIQSLFKEKISALATRINQKVGSDAVNIALDEVNYGNGPIDYTIRFQIINERDFENNGNDLLIAIWDEFSKCLNELK